MNILNDLVESECNFTQIRQKLFSNLDERFALIHSGLHNPSQRGTCLRLLEFLSLQE